MKVLRTFLFALLLVCPSHAQKDKVSPERTNSNPPPPVIVNVQAPASPSEKISDDGESLDIQRKLVIFTGALALVGVLQVCAMLWQGWVLAQTLGAIKQQAEIARTTLVSSFRPIIVVRRLALNPRSFAAYMAANDRIWKVELTLANQGSTKATIEKCELKISVFGENPLPWQGDSTDFASTQWTNLSVPAAGRLSLEFVIPRDSSFSVSFGTQVEMLDMTHNHGQAVWPTCHGTIVYVDDNGPEDRPDSSVSGTFRRTIQDFQRSRTRISGLAKARHRGEAWGDAEVPLMSRLVRRSYSTQGTVASLPGSNSNGLDKRNCCSCTVRRNCPHTL